MAYIGNTAPSRFVSNRAASVYSGDGSTVAFTLEQVVTQDEDVLVSVDGVVQEPSVAYAVSNGTTLTFTAAPSSNSGNNIFVYYLASQAGTIGHPAAQNLSAGTGTFTGDVTIGDASAADKKILFDGNAQDFYIGLDDSSDILAIGNGSDLGASRAIIVDANGIIRKSQQPAFMALSVADANLRTDATSVTLNFSTEIYDTNSDYNTSTKTFTAPVTGRYFLSLFGYLLNVDTAATYVQVSINTSNRTYNHLLAPKFASDPAYLPFSVQGAMDMDAGDTAFANWNASGGTAQVDTDAGSSFSGFLLG